MKNILKLPYHLQLQVVYEGVVENLNQEDRYSYGNHIKEKLLMLNRAGLDSMLSDCYSDTREGLHAFAKVRIAEYNKIAIVS